MMSTSPARIIFAGGGTGGHLYPALAIANRLRELLSEDGGVEILFVGTRRGIEYRLRDSLGYPLHLVNMRGIVRSLSLKNLLLPFVVAGALWNCSRMMKSFRPDIVVGTGGYVAWPVLNRAASRGITTVIQEQNSFPGIVTRRAAPGASRIYLGFDGARKYLPSGAPTLHTGNPVRATIGSASRDEAIQKFDLDPSKKTILILGGSQGAHAINQAILKSLNESTLPDNIQILWQTGKRDYKDVAAQAGDKVSGRSLFPFAENMELVYAAADMAIARAGALTLAELTVCGIPSLVVPYPYAAGDHQRKNAEESTQLNHARMIDESELATHDLLDEAATIMNSEKFEQMSTALKKHNHDRRPAVDVIAEDIISLMKNKSTTGDQLHAGASA